MRAPISLFDASIPSPSSLDLADALEHLSLMAMEAGTLIERVGLQGATSAQIGPRGSHTANLTRMRFEEAVIAFRVTLCAILTGTPAGTYAAETDLAQALSARIEANDGAAGLYSRTAPIDASCKHDPTQAADAALTANARARGEAIVASLSAYNAFDTAPSAAAARAIGDGCDETVSPAPSYPSRTGDFFSPAAA